ncbi:hypothetical protein [Desertibaculum subflavum]|uniref:hypothetical protein n=1 Tax=Desertibaculum subflavum TaxID=2268458 RepID=UPI000E67082C
MTRAVLAALLCLAALPAAAQEAFRPLPAAPQTMYRAGVPHIDAAGGIRTGFDPARSLFVIGIAHALQGRFHGADHDLALFQGAGFNTVVPFQLLDRDMAVRRARELGLKLTLPEATADHAARFKGDSTILAFEVDHEPSVAVPDESAGERLKRFLASKAAIQEIDPQRLVMTVNSPSITPPRTELWRLWSRASDLHAHWKYPFMRPPVTSLAGERGLPETFALALEETRAAKPIWYYAQAFASPVNRWFLPSAAQARGMLYAAIVHGATGVIWFAFDSPVTRNGRVIGVAPDTSEAAGAALPYGPYPPIAASAAEAAASRALWQSIRVLNREIAALAPALLGPTADIPYRVYLAGAAVSATPIRSLLKVMPNGDLLLIAVNIDNVSLEASFFFPGRRFVLSRLHDDPLGPDGSAGIWRDTFAPFGVRLYRLAPLAP